MALPLAKIEEIHRDLWLASQLASSAARTVASGHAMLDAELPGQGWPTGSLSEILVPQPGCGEVRLLKPALAATAARPVMLLQPPHPLQPAALSWWGLDPGNIRVLTPRSTADALWAAEQILRSGTVGALLFWQQQVRAEALRRLQLAAQRSETLFFLFRPMAAATTTSPAPLRVSLEATAGGLNVSFVKRRGPHRDEPVFVPLSPSPVLLNRNAPLDRRSSAAPAHREFLPDVAHASA
ncbi:translesion DNA synthesis-associated protein ImuA [Paraburkholderia acidisoli]|uniref:Translesion DNA synthesis-associated protein ImuA n=1 Tax=Paraburkholderia acidisoli TaxID=2571748 RepID=A0A7Z2GS37_9BURK|nr:translesion DNA synthesis-associated protein ImuA [Paraburkholderia acidisoli]QGZ66947.1 translesion DNA synthesis-associated protein ImuA [Paraburkholderia acidisoli]